jgi:hypothetical protein
MKMQLVLRRVLLLSAMALVATPAHRGQSVQKNQTSDSSEAVLLERGLLLSDLQTLEWRAKKLAPLPRASAKAEIADAAWTLDPEWSKKK